MPIWSACWVPRILRSISTRPSGFGCAEIGCTCSIRTQADASTKRSSTETGRPRYRLAATRQLKMSLAMPTGARRVVESLKSYGVDIIFGIPGIHNLATYDALVDEPSLRVVTTRDERGAAHMADGFARATGRPGVCLTVPGPGVTNAMTAIGEAYADSSPVLLLASQLPAATANKDCEDFHQLRHPETVLASVTQWGVRPACADEIGPAVEAIFRRFEHARP